MPLFTKSAIAFPGFWRKKACYNVTTKILTFYWVGHSTHKAKPVKNFIADHKKQIELHFLPPYYPELNSDECVWGNVKRRVAKSCRSSKI
jgi:transposase